MTIISWDFPNQNWIWILPAVERLMRKLELTESRAQGLDLDLEIHTQSTDVTTNTKKDVIKGANLLRNGYLRAGDALQRHRPPHQSRPRPTQSSVLYHAKSRKRSRSRSHSPHDRSRSDKRGRRDNQKQGSNTGERQASEQVSNLAFRVQRMEGFLEQIATHMRLSSQVSIDAEPGPGDDPQRPGPTLGPHHNGALPKRSVDLGRRRDDDEVSLLASGEGIPDPPQVGQDLSQVCFSPVPGVTTKWSPHEVITSYVSKYFGVKPIKKPFQLRSSRIMEHQILTTL